MEIISSEFVCLSDTIHFIGIGGIGMSALAKILKLRGYSVQGSDIKDNDITQELENLGINVMQGHSADHIAGASLIVKSSAIADNNVELIAAYKKQLKIISRADILAMIMQPYYSIAVTGTHGKTTTTALIGVLCTEGNLMPTIINGGVINQYSSNAINGDGSILITEADESDGSFLKLPVDIAVITNIDSEHMDFYHNMHNVICAYKQFIEKIASTGYGVLCYDHPVVKEISGLLPESSLISYGIAKQADINAHNIKTVITGSTFDIAISEKIVEKMNLQYNVLEGVYLNLYGQHNVQNALAAVAVAIKMGISKEIILKTLANFQGIKRRFTVTGEVNGIRVIDDYAHHPKEIEASLKVAKSIASLRGGKVIAVMQPHRYTRLANLMEEFSTAFSDADQIIICEVYEAQEFPIAGINSQVLTEKINKKTGKDIILLDEFSNLPIIINQTAKTNDIVILLGAGDITNYAYELPRQLKVLRSL